MQLRNRVVIAMDLAGGVVESLVIKSEGYASARAFYGAVNGTIAQFKEHYPNARILSGTASSSGDFFWSHPEYTGGATGYYSLGKPAER